MGYTTLACTIPHAAIQFYFYAIGVNKLSGPSSEGVFGLTQVIIIGWSLLLSW